MLFNRLTLIKGRVKRKEPTMLNPSLNCDGLEHPSNPKGLTAQEIDPAHPKLNVMQADLFNFNFLI